MRSPLNWYGGKFYMADLICALMPEHICYVEVFGGAGHVLFKKPESRVEVYNDIHDGLVTLFRVIRDYPEELWRRLSLTLYSRSEFKVMQERYRTQNFKDEIEKAMTVFYLVRNSINGKMNSFSTHMKHIHVNKPTTYFRMVDLIPEIAKRLRNVIIENLDFRDLIKKYDSKDTLFYLDPPYVISSRRDKSKAYEHEMTYEDHINLIEILKNAKGKWILSGYHNELYDRELSNYYSKRVKITIKSTTNSKPRKYATEVLWFNYEPPEQIPLFEGSREVVIEEEENETED
jgi:DNA adenine methylase